ncbi:MAG: hypothetical protein QMD11_03690 [Smithella sp.]|nr:hypothetical protein [Smithella sp.]
MMRKKIAEYLMSKQYIQNLMHPPADLSEFKERPTPRLIAGLILMAVSYIMGWPVIAALSVLAVWWTEPLIFVIGGPVAYALSCVVFFIGAWLARAPHYLGVLTRYSLQVVLKKIL